MTGLAGQDQPVLLRVADPLDEGGRFEQRLGRDAAAVEARAADLVLVDEGDLQAELGRAEGGGVAAGSGAEHDEIEVVGGADGHGSGSLGSLRVAGHGRRPVGRWIIASDGTRGVPSCATEPTGPSRPSRC